ncbi:MAG: trypsin-like peptidase domain-containing protein [Nitrososphaeraceae archaeon]|nr:trypsin-like peptidase domain-containing protein [Nitrososphaeraceae archaeon]MDW0139443.1 trypsin-like peptidase domain-containing protein [Nitrososphaeraceae archaeon]MDW0146540.1 trypsin-like peptidase domain-containing protein [Nitrososphaeraceae archaeon]MDW0154138.1 trypsin-like peptidase domain-containing protein [Nitrososphaeraceae archaeon]MDW3653863.1 trypsin-like peptidase domain-containing protein [Nitrososphaeraceae archaeon]
MIPIPEESIINAVESVSKSVVNIASVRMMQDQLFRVFPVQGVGSGIVIDARGHILTNNHVIDGTDRLRVTFGDSKQVNAKVVGKDEETDLAVVRAELDTNSNDEITLQPANFGNSEELKVGQIVMALGNPFGLTGGPTVTAGIISSLNRNVQFDNGILELVQTDAAINPGNSGGPLINTNGEVVAINTAKIPYGQGIGFAVPINTVKSVLTDLVENGHVTRPWIGISTVKLDPRIANFYRLPLVHGALIVNVEPYSPADNAGLRRGDIIEEINGNKIENPSQISSYIRKKKMVNDTVTVAINRYGRVYEVHLQLEARP